MATTTYYLRRTVATTLGVGLVGLSGYFSWHHTGDLIAPIAAVVGAAMLHFAEAAWSERQRIRAVAFAALAALASLICLLAVLDRVATAYDTKLVVGSQTTCHGSRLRRPWPRQKPQQRPTRRPLRLECGSGRGSRCTGLEQRADISRRRVTEARNKLVRLGSAIVEDPAAKRLAAFLPVSEGTIGLATPLLLPVWLELSGLVLLTYGLAPRHKPVKQPRLGKTKKKRCAPRKPPTSSARVIPFKKAAN